jgi:tRNA-splicing ligase RtcB
MDDPRWQETNLLSELKDNAWLQLGTSGSGNHFVEWGIVFLLEPYCGLVRGSYVGLLSHSGSRGTGNKVCRHYTDLAKKQNPAGELSWLDLDSEAGQEYWLSMELMGDYAAANHECIHKAVLARAGLPATCHIENHHNFAWKENGLIVHRKGATPASFGTFGVIPGSMASDACIVRGKGNPLSIDSASHGAGRAMSRKQAKKKFQWGPWREHLKEKNVRLLDAGLDEVPGAYKPIGEVMAAQEDLVDIVGTFEPRIVLMCGDGSRPED